MSGKRKKDETMSPNKPNKRMLQDIVRRLNENTNENNKRVRRKKEKEEREREKEGKKREERRSHRIDEREENEEDGKEGEKEENEEENTDEKGGLEENIEEKMVIVKILFIAGVNFESEGKMLSFLSRLKEEKLNLPANAMFKIRGMLKSKEESKHANKIFTKENAKNHKLYFLSILEKDIRNLHKCFTKLITVYRCISRIKDIELINERLASVKVCKKKRRGKREKRKKEKNKTYKFNN